MSATFKVDFTLLWASINQPNQRKITNRQMLEEKVRDRLTDKGQEKHRERQTNTHSYRTADREARERRTI